MKKRTKVVTTAGVIASTAGGLLLYFGSLPPGEVVEACKARGFEPVEISDETWACGTEGQIKAFLEGADPVIITTGEIARRTR